MKSKLLDDATKKTLALTYSTESRRKKRDAQTLTSNGDVEAEEIDAGCEAGYKTIDDDQCRTY